MRLLGKNGKQMEEVASNLVYVRDTDQEHAVKMRLEHRGPPK
jgi:hypothetical protein